MRSRTAAGYYLLGSAVQRGSGVLILLVLAHSMGVVEYSHVVLLSAAYPLFVAVFGIGLEIPLARAAASHSEALELGLLYNLRLVGFRLLAALALLLVATAALRGGTLIVATEMEAISAVVLAAFLYPLVVTARARGQAGRASSWATVFLVGPQISRVIAVLLHSSAIWYSAGGLGGHLLLMAGWSWRRHLQGPREARILLAGLPFLPHVLGHWALALSDRLLIGLILGSSAVAAYGPNYQLVALLGLVFIETNRALTPSYGNPSVPTGVLLQQCRKVLAGQVLVAFAAMAIVPIASRLLLPASLQLRTPQLLVLVLGQLSYGCYLLAANELILRRGDTRVAVLTVSAAAGSICLNAVLLPTVGLAGAALTTALTYSGLALAAVARINHDGDRTSVPVRTLASVAATAAVASCAIIAFT